MTITTSNNNLKTILNLKVTWVNGGYYIIQEGQCLFGMKAFSRRFPTRAQAEKALEKYYRELRLPEAKSERFCVEYVRRNDYELRR